ncbi:DUF262 domain-containing protein [Spirosoma linguale]
MLLPGEKLNFSALENLDKRLSSTDEESNEKYEKGDVRIVTEQARYPLVSVVSMVTSSDYELNPEFQRRHRWDKTKQSRLIESFIMNVPIPPIFLYEVKYAKYEVMDGLQRLTAIHDFYSDNLVLEGLVEWPELNGKKYSQLPTQIKSGVDRRYLSSIILLQETAKTYDEAQRLKQLVFERINSGGVTLEPQEARNAIYNGNLNQLCIKLARNEYLCRTWDIPLPTPEEINTGEVSDELLKNEFFRKMSDVELVLRFFAFRQRPENPKGTLKEFLDTYLKYGNNFSIELLSQMEIIFNDTISLVYEILGKKAFRLWRQRKKQSNQSWDWYNRPGMTAYDPIMYVFSQNLGRREEIISKKEQINSNITKFYEDNYISFGGHSTTNISSINDRNKVFAQFLDNILE